MRFPHALRRPKIIGKEYQTVYSNLHPFAFSGPHRTINNKSFRSKANKLSQNPSPRFQRRRRTALFEKMQSWIQFLSTPTVDTPGTALILFFDDRRYIIGNVHEGLVRSAAQMGTKLVKVSDIFITGTTEWKNIGGLLGLMLSIADSTSAAIISSAEQAAQKLASLTAKRGNATIPSDRNIEKLEREQAQLKKLAAQGIAVRPSERNGKQILTVHGAPNITHTLATARRFIFRRGLPVRVEEPSDYKERNPSDTDWPPDWVDSKVQIWALAVAPLDNAQTSSSTSSSLKRMFDDFLAESGTTPALNNSPSTSNVPTLGPPVSNPLLPDPPTHNESLLDPLVEDQKARQEIVSHMFDSSWRTDDLKEVPLQEVELPAELFVRNKNTETIEPYNGPLPDGTNVLPEINVLVRKPWPGALVHKLPLTRPSNIAMSYMIKNHNQRGSFIPEKAKALNVPPGRLWGLLASGMSVQSADGRTITPDMVLQESRAGGGVAVMDLPTADYVHNLVSRPEWHVSKIMAGIKVIIWILGPGVGQNEDLQKFVLDNNHLKHIFSSQDHCPNSLAFGSSASAAIRLNQIDQKHFPIPIHNNVSLSQFWPPQIEHGKSPEYVQAKRGLKVHLAPVVAIKDEDVTPTLNTAAILQEMPQDVLELAQAAKKNIASSSVQEEIENQNLPSPDAEIICLGTGSSAPSKYRNVSATLLRVPGSGSYLFDCGENTLGQLRRIYAPESLAEVLNDLKLIWISHLHADHHLGITAVIKAWRDEVPGKLSTSQKHDSSLAGLLRDPVKTLRSTNPLFVVSSVGMLNWLKDYSSVEDFGFDHVVPLNTLSRLNCDEFELEDERVGFGDAHGEM